MPRSAPLLISPELALVDPELADAAREMLPEPGALCRPRATAGTSAKHRPERRPVVGVVMGVVGLLALILTALVGLALVSDTVRQRVTVASAPGDQPTRNHLSSGPRPAPAGESRRDRRASETAPRRNAGQPTKESGGSVSTGKRLPPLVWPRVASAHAYSVQLYQHGRRIFSRSTTRQRLQLPSFWLYRGARYRLGDGTYRWMVVPLRGRRGRPRHGIPIVDATLMVGRPR
jgi:hypothetical protein